MNTSKPKYYSIAVFFVCLFVFPLSIAIGSTKDTQKFIDGYRNTYSTNGHSKSKGLNINISYPKSWLSKEGERPNIVQKFISSGGTGRENALIITRALPNQAGTTIPKQEINDILNISEIKNMLPAGSTYIAANKTKIAGLPAVAVEYSIRYARAGKEVYLQNISYIFIYKTILVQLQCWVSSTKPTDLAQRMAEFKPLFLLMAKSITLNK